jgi:hypothetical protein
MTYATSNQPSASLEAKLNQLIQRLESLETSLQRLAKPGASRQQIACAEALVGFATVINTLLYNPAPAGITISHAKTLHLETEDGQVVLTLQTYQGYPLFSGSQINGEWHITLDRLTEDEKLAIIKLPQSKQEYTVTAHSQALVRHLHRHLPDRLNAHDTLTFVWTEDDLTRYEFELVTLPNGAQVVQGFDPEDDELVFDALFTLGQPPEIRHCAIPLEELELLVHEHWNWEIETTQALEMSRLMAEVPIIGAPTSEVKFIAPERQPATPVEREHLALS